MIEGSADWLVYSSVKLARTTVPAISRDASEFSPVSGSGHRAACCPETMSFQTLPPEIWLELRFSITELGTSFWRFLSDNVFSDLLFMAFPMLLARVSQWLS